MEPVATSIVIWNDSSNVIDNDAVCVHCIRHIHGVQWKKEDDWRKHSLGRPHPVLFISWLWQPARLNYHSHNQPDNQPDSITIHTSYTIWNLCVKIESQTAALLQAYPPSSTAVDGNGFCYRSYCKTLGPFYQYPQSVSSTDASPCLCLSLCLTLSLSLSLTVCVKQ